MNRSEWCLEAKRRFELLFAVSEPAAEEAREQAGLPEVWACDLVPVRKAMVLCVACRIRLEQAGLCV